MTRPLFVAGAILCVCTSLSAKPGLPFNKHEIFRHFFQVTFKGKVSSQSGENLQGVTITVKGAKVSTISGIDGTFNIQLPAGSTTLVFSYVGFEQQEVNVAGMGSVAVQLKPVEVSLSDVIVVGYGTQKKVNLTGAVVAVTGAELNKRPSPNASNLLQGKVPGLQVTQPSAEPGRDNGTFLIRGKSTFGGSTAPLVLIDGVTGNINNLAPGDIENVVVLKDAASAAIYGSRAANGVILVTTKKGKKGNAVINYSVNVGRWTPTALPDLITNSAEYMTMYNTAAARSGVCVQVRCR